MIAEENLNVKIGCALPGLTTGYGPSHQATEDVAIFRGIAEPDDRRSVRRARNRAGGAAIAAHKGPVYMRLLRGNVPLVLDEYDYTFELGKAKLLRDGADVLIISSGFMTMRALEAAQALRRGQGRRRACCTCPTIKPLDEATILRRGAKGTAGRGGREPFGGRRPRRGGRGHFCCAIGRQPAGFRQIGLPDAFLDAGALPTLHERYGISTGAVARRIKAWQSQ